MYSFHKTGSVSAIQGSMLAPSWSQHSDLSCSHTSIIISSHFPNSLSSPPSSTRLSLPHPFRFELRYSSEINISCSEERRRTDGHCDRQAASNSSQWVLYQANSTKYFLVPFKYRLNLAQAQTTVIFGSVWSKLSRWEEVVINSHHSLLWKF